MRGRFYLNVNFILFQTPATRPARITAPARTRVATIAQQKVPRD